MTGPPLQASIGEVKVSVCGTEAIQCNFGRAQSRWIAENYNVSSIRVEQIINILGVTPSVDAFAMAPNQRFTRWWGPGSCEATNAFSMNWGEEPLLWMNPPFSLLREVIKKIERDRAHAIVILPEWKVKCWYREALELRLLDLRYPKGVHFFERPGTRKRPTPWPVRVMFLCGHNPQCEPTKVCNVTFPLYKPMQDTRIPSLSPKGQRGSERHVPRGWPKVY